MLPFIDLKAQQKKIRTKIDKRIKSVLDHGQYILGPEVKELEDKLGTFANSKYVLCCSSGTDALLLALLGLNLKPGEGVIVPAFTFASSAEVIPLLGAVPIFIDVDPETFNLDPNKLSEALETALIAGIDVKGIMPVGLFGQPADMDPINNFAKENGLFVLDDAAQSFGSKYKNNIVGNLCDVTCTSFFPAKPLGCFGDGGAVFTSNNALAEKIKSLRVHGQTQPYTHKHVGLGARLDNLQAAVLLIKLKSYNDAINMRQAAAERYHKMLHGLIKTPIVKNYNTSVWAQYSIRIPSRDLIKLKLEEQGIPTAVYYPKPLHLQKCFEYLNYKTGDFPVSENAAKEIISLPINPYITVTEQKFIVEELKKCL